MPLQADTQKVCHCFAVHASAKQAPPAPRVAVLDGIVPEEVCLHWKLEGDEQRQALDVPPRPLPELAEVLSALAPQQQPA
eukprot:3704216-Rhodomonas_salina.2